MYLQQILKESPNIPGYGGGKWAMYSIGCCWWTSYPEDLGELPPMHYDYENKKIIPNPGGPGLPCCPHCHSVLMQAPLEDFIKSAQEVPEYYGRMGIDAFIEAHSRNSRVCHQKWDDYADDINRRFHPKLPPTYA